MEKREKGEEGGREEGRRGREREPVETGWKPDERESCQGCIGEEIGGGEGWSGGKRLF